MSNRKKRCKQCKEYVDVKNGLHVPVGFFCCFNHAREFATLALVKRQQAQRAKAKQSQAKRSKANSAALRDHNAQDLGWQHKQTQKAFNKMRKLEEKKWFKDRGLEPECISCGKHLGGDQWCCGHFKTLGAQPELRYDRRNTYLQHNYNCNKNLSGDITGTKTTRGYKNGLRERFGAAEGQAIIDYCESHTASKKWTCDELDTFRKECNEKIRILERD